MKKLITMTLISLPMLFSSNISADEACVTPNGYYYNESLEFDLKNVFSGNNPRQNLNLYLSTEDNLSQYQNTGKPKFFPNGEIIIYLPTKYANRENVSSVTTGIRLTSKFSDGIDLNSIKKILPNTFPSFKRRLLRNGYVSNFMMTDDYSKNFSEQFNQYPKSNLVSLKNIGTIVDENFSFASMGITTHQINGEIVKFARAFGAIYKPNKKRLQYVLISKKISDEQDDSNVQEIQENFENIITSLTNCIYAPHNSNVFTENYKNSIYEGEIQGESGSYIEKLRELKSLFDDEIINEEDFEKMKQKIIDNM